MSNFFQLNQGASRKRETATSTTTPWVEKYRPRTVDEVAFQDEVVAVLKKSLTSNDFPHLLFYGPPGTGKTSTILAIARQMFGPELMKTRILELNASDERGISVVREKVKTFAQISATQVVAKGYPCPPFKIIILDEADSMTADAQSALRRMMETYSKTTRFCLICNYVSRIIEPLASRCAKFRFKPLDAGILTEKLTAIGDKEGLQIDASAINQLTAASGGDMRRAITLMQCCFRLNGSDPITADDVVAAAGVVPDDMIRKLWKECASGSFEKVQAAVKEIEASGFSAEQVLSQAFEQFLARPDMTDAQKSAIALAFANSDRQLVDGADESLQLLSVFSSTMETLSVVPM